MNKKRKLTDYNDFELENVCISDSEEVNESKRRRKRYLNVSSQETVMEFEDVNGDINLERPLSVSLGDLA